MSPSPPSIVVVVVAALHCPLVVHTCPPPVAVKACPVSVPWTPHPPAPPRPASFSFFLSLSVFRRGWLNRPVGGWVVVDGCLRARTPITSLHGGHVCTTATATIDGGDGDIAPPWMSFPHVRSHPCPLMGVFLAACKENTVTGGDRTHAYLLCGVCGDCGAK